jgi:CHAT domain-containing protein/Tfp pilus assembly protein PilF
VSVKKNQKKGVIFFIFFASLLAGQVCSASVWSNFKTEKDSIQSDDQKLIKQFNRAVDFLRRGDYQYSKQSFENAVATIQKNEISDPNMIYRTYVNYGVLCGRLGDRKNALINYEIAEKFTLKEFGSDSPKLIPLYTNMGHVYMELKDNVKAQTYSEKALFLTESDPNSRWYSRIINNLGAILYQKGEYTNALDYLLETLSIKKKRNETNVSSTLVNIGNCYKKMGEYEKADLYLNLGIKNLVEQKGENYYILGDAYLNYAVFLKESDKRKSVLNFLNKSFSIYMHNFGKKHPSVTLCLRNKGEYYLEDKNTLKALKYYQKAIISDIQNFNDSSFYSNPKLDKIDPQLSIVETLKSKAGGLRQLYKDSNNVGDLDFSLETFDLCLDIIDKIRIAYQDEESKFELSKNEKETYTLAIEIAVELYQLTKEAKYKEKAFRYAERSKAASLMSSLNDVNAKTFGGIPTDLQEQESTLKRDIAKYRELVYEERKKASPDREKISAWQDELFTLNQKYNEMVARFEEDYPEYYTLKYDNKTISIEELQDKLSDNDVLLEYSISDSALFTFVVTKDSFDILRKEISLDTIDKHFEQVRSCLKTNDFGKRSAELYKNYIVSAYSLYTDLIKPNESIIKNKKLLIVPDGKMAYIPFGVLLTEKADSSMMNYRNLNYLIKNNTITYQNSATLGFSIESAGFGFSSHKNVLAFAPSYDDVDDSILYAERAYRDKLYPLPGVKEEVNNISKIIEGDIYVDDLATEKNFKEHAADYDVLHLAMHTIIDDENPMYSKLVFTQDQDTTQDGLLNTHEIYNMNFNARMVVLSACNTGDGKLLKGEGVISLARGFFYAGCPSIIMTLWTVEDQTGSNLMSNFYKYLAQGMLKDEALRQAKLSYLETADPLKSHPYFWSGYVTMGDVEPLYNIDLRQKLLYTAFGSLGLILLFFIRRRIRKKRVA